MKKLVSCQSGVNGDLLRESLVFARNHASIEEKEVNLIMACRKSVLFNSGNVWTKKDKDFDVTMGAQDGTEIADLTGIYLLKQVNEFLSSVSTKSQAGLYRDDGLICIEDANKPLISKIEKALHRIFKRNKLNISIEQKGHTINFLDVTLSTDGSHKPYKKPNSTIKYVNKGSNHPPSITKNIPSSIQKRLNSISSCEREFIDAKDEYQRALTDAGCTHELAYDTEKNKSADKRKRKRRIVWFNPPYSKNVATNIGKEFFNLLRIHFPKQHPLNHLFNKHTVKLSYSCTINMDGIIKAHNAKILRKEDDNMAKDVKTCNCRDKPTCPVGNKCLRSNVVYKATAEYEDKRNTTLV